MKPQRVSYPKKAPFVVYTDLQSSLKPEGDDDVTTGLTKEKKKERVYQTQEAASYWCLFTQMLMLLKKRISTWVKTLQNIEGRCRKDLH